MKVIVYTCITGNYDSVVELDHKEDNIEYLLFTNNKNLKSNTWKIKYIDEDLDDWTLCRKVKIQYYKYLPKHDVSIYIDGAIKILKPISIFLKTECDLNNYDFIGFKHQQRDCIYDELKANILCRKETVENCKKIEKFLLSESYPHHNGLLESTVIIRKDVKSVRKLVDDWFYMVKNYSRRDQLSFNYCLWKNKFSMQQIDMYVFDNKYFKHIGHLKPQYVTYRVLFEDVCNYDWHNVIDGKELIDYKTHKVTIKFKVLKDTNCITIQIYDEAGSKISNIKVNNRNSGSVLNNYNYNDYGTFLLNTSNIAIKKKLRKGEEVTLTFNILRLDNNDYLEAINNKCNQCKLLDEELTNKIMELDICKRDYDDLKQKFYDVLNSKTYQLADNLRKICYKIIKPKKK